MERITVNLGENVAGRLTDRAKAERRSVSSFVEILIEQDLRGAGLLPAADGEDDAEFHAQLNKALEVSPALKPKIKRLARNAIKEAAIARA